MISRIYQGPRYPTLAKATSLFEVAQKKASRARKDLASKVLELRKLVHDGNNTLSLLIVTASSALEDLESGNGTTETLKEDLKMIAKQGTALTATLERIRAVFVPSVKLMKSAAPAISPIKFDGPATTVKNILVVDDEPASRTVLKCKLAKAGFSTTQAANAEEALPLLAKGQFDLVITDVDMNPEGISGLEFSSLITREFPRTVVFVMSGENTAERDQAAINHGAARFFPKPIDLNDILTAIGDLSK